MPNVELVFEVAHVADVRAAEGVDRLVVVAHREDRVGLPGQQLQPGVLQLVGVLKLVDENVLEACLIVGAQRRIVCEQFKAAQQQFRKVDDAFALALLVVGFVEFDEFAVEVVGGVDVFRAQALLFGIVDEVLEIFRRVLFIVDVKALHQTLDRGELVGGIEDLEGGGQACVAMVRAEHAVA